MEDRTAEIILLLITTIGVIASAWFKSNISALGVEIKNLKRRTNVLESDNRELKAENKSLRARISEQAQEIKELYSRLIGNGVF